jgi:transcription initiation factor IIE alpha subunit
MQVQLFQVACQVTRVCSVCRCRVHLADSSAGAHRTTSQLDTLVEEFMADIGEMFR